MRSRSSIVLGFVAACSAGDDAPTLEHASVHAPRELASAPDDGSAGIPLACQGFPLEGLLQSPGGDVLPNKCKPFDVTTNNPYAVRCIDAWPWYKTPYRGDEYCILPPPADKGIQVGYHPQGADYWKQVSRNDLSGYANVPAKWTVAPGAEETGNYREVAPNPTPRKYYRTYFRMRTGSHHNIISMHRSNAPAGWMPTNGEALPGFFEPDAGPLIGILGGQERPSDNTPVTFEVPPEDVDLYAMFPENPSILYNVHYFNTSRQPALKEGWVNIWWEDEGTRRVNWFMGLDLLQTVDLNIPPNETRDLHYAFTPSSTVRLINFFGHRHAWTPNFSSWVERKDGRVELIYQSFSWMDMPTFRYDSVVKNPVPDAARRVDGGASGILTLSPGDELHFNCRIAFTDARALEEGAPRPASIGNLRFANQALTAEMCIGFGTTTGGVLGRPRVSGKAIPEAIGR